MKPKQVVNHFGTQTAVAVALGMRQPSVAEWVRKGHVPFLRQIQIEQATKGELRASGAAKRQYTHLVALVKPAK